MIRAARSAALIPQQLAHEPQGSCLVAPRLDQQIEDLAFAVNRSPQVHTPALD
jgi:hypothetical protein